MITRNGSAVHDRSTAGDGDAAVVAQLHSLAPHLDGEPDPAWRDATRARLVAMAAVRSPEPEPVSPLRRLLAARESDAPPARWRTRLTAGLAGAALTVTALATLVALSTDARPGDVLYGLKRGTEQTQLALAGDARRGETLLDHASTRLGELELLLADGPSALPAAGGGSGPADQVVLAAGSDAELVLETLDTMDAQTADGAAWMTDRAVTRTDAGPLEELTGWAAGQSARLSSLAPSVPDEASGAVDDSLELLARIATRTADLRPALDCAGGPATDGADELGPVPGVCAAPLPAPAPSPQPDPDVTADPTPSPGPTGEVPVPSGTEGPSVGMPGSGATTGGSGGGTPGSEVPPRGLDKPTLPVPSVEVPLPTITVPGGQGTGSPPSIGLDLDVCLGPIRIGAC